MTPAPRRHLRGLLPPVREHAREYVILVGLLCQGMANGHWAFGIMAAAVWFTAIGTYRRTPLLPEAAEALLLLSGLIAGLHLAIPLQIPWFVSMSNSLVIYQFLRLLERPQRGRRFYTLCVALTHIAVGSQTLLDWRFVIVLGVTLVLLPVALAETQLENQGLRGWPSRRLLGPRRVIPLAVGMLVFFLTAPRWELLRLRGGSTAGRQQLQMNLADSGGPDSDQLIFRVSGEDIGYLRTVALDVFDGSRWVASPFMFRNLGTVRSDNLEGTQRREVTIVTANALGDVLPVDGYPVHFRGLRYMTPHRMEHGGVMLPMARRRSYVYEYWTQRAPPELTPLAARDRRRYLMLPARPSPPVETLLANVVGREDDPKRIAARLTHYLRNDFTYRADAPRLDEEVPLEDFLFRSREGHCSRFASALAVLLRVKGIPSRIVVGYLPLEHNRLAGFYNIRARHAHAWTEAWFADEGWVTLDATPVGDELPLERQRFALTVYEWIEYFWYSDIVDFGRSEQRRVNLSIQGGIRAAGQRLWSARGGVLAATLLATLAAGVFAIRRRARRRARRVAAAAPAAVFAQRFYRRFLRLMAGRGLPRDPHTTPWEYAAVLQNAGFPLTDELAFLTRRFCELRYGGKPVGEESVVEIEATIKQVRRSLKGWGPQEPGR